jgi:hypothetical protein
VQYVRVPLYDTDPQTNATIEVFYADRALEHSAEAAPVGSGAPADAAFRQQGWLDRLGTVLGTLLDIPLDITIKSEV